MYLNQEKKQEIFALHGFAKSASDTGSPESQIALFTHRISHLTEHLKKNHKDYSTRQGLLKLVGKRRRLLDYLHKTDISRYRAIVAKLNLRK
ncbi:MAG: 30S ribosomal protein S15 [Spirosomataceae bacterium]